MKVAIQGIAGSFHHQAAIKFFKTDKLDLTECDTFRDVFDSVQNTEAEYGVIAVENSLHGSINPVYRLLAEQKLNVCGEVRLKISMYLIGCNNKQKVELEVLDTSDTEILSQREAISQCEFWLNEFLPNARITETKDTAQAVRYVVHTKSENFLAIAGEAAAKMYSGQIVAGPINDEIENYTRFFVISKDKVEIKDADRTSIILKESQADSAGNLYQAIGVFAELGINLSKLDSHPLPGKQRKYAFYIDFDESINTDTGKKAIQALKKQNWDMQILGSYKS